MTCAHPRCNEEIVTPFKAKMRADVYHSALCRNRDTRRLIQLRRRETPEQRAYERRAKLLAKYGVTEAEWDVLFTMQEGRCAICRVDLASVKTCVDHDHNTGLVRGLLCTVCNQGLGYFADDVARMERAVDYLQGAAAAAERRGEVMST